MTTPRRSMPSALALSAAAAGLAMLAGCSSGEARTTVDASSAASPNDDYKVVHLDDDFKGKLAIGNVARRVVEDFLQVQVTLVSTASEPLRIETSWEWYDRDGFRVRSSRDGWIPAELGARTTREVRSVAPTAAVDSFKFHVRAAMPITGHD